MKEKIKKTIGLMLVSILALIPLTPHLEAASASMSVKSSKSTVVVGSTFTVTITVSSSSELGSWKFTPLYDSSKLKLMSGDERVADVVRQRNIKSKSYTYTFKAIAKGSSTINLGAAEVLNYDEETLTVKTGSVRITSITQAELEASYSKNNNLSSIGVEGYTLNESFNKDTTEYTVTVPSNVEKINLTGKVEDSKASVSGLGEFDVSEGENKFDVVVTAENGSQKTYTVKVNVEDSNPIIVDIDGKSYKVVKRASALTAPSTYESTTQVINGVEVPAFISNITSYVLVGLKSDEGTTNLYIYNEENNSYTLYKEIKTEGILIFPKKAKVVPDYYKKTTITINEETVEAYLYDGVEDYYLIYGVNIENNEECFYQYDVKNNTIARYNDKIINELTKKNENFMLIIIILGVETILLLIILIGMMIRKNKKKNIKQKNEKETINKIEENKKQKETKQNVFEKNTKTLEPNKNKTNESKVDKQ